MKKIILLLFCTFSTLVFSQEKQLHEITGKEITGAIRASFTPVQMPTKFDPSLEKTMGLFGLHYQVFTNNWLYVGAAMKTAVTGDQGGLFTLGIEAGATNKLFGNIYSDVNFHFAGGGGYRYLVNGGGMINANLGLAYKTNQFNFGVQYSYLNFFTGKIKSNSVSFYLEIPTYIRAADYSIANQDFLDSNTSFSFWNKIGTKSVQQVRFDFFYPRGNSKKDNGSDLTETLYVLGFEYQKYIASNTFIFAHTDAIYKGLRAGFMDLFIGGGHNFISTNYLNLFGKLGIGAAGGRIAPEGGLTIYPSAGFDFNISKKIAISGHGGYYKALAGDFEAYTLGLGIKYKTLSGGNRDLTNKKQKHFTAKGISLTIENQTYFNVQKTDARDTHLQLLALKVGYDLNPSFYLLGEASFAYEGESGGYAHGVIGLGYRTKPFFNSLAGFAEFYTGAAGGAGVDTGEGIIIKPTIGLSYQINDEFKLRTSVGQLVSPFGNLNTTNINIGVTYNFATLVVK